MMHGNGGMRDGRKHAAFDMPETILLQASHIILSVLAAFFAPGQAFLILEILFIIHERPRN